jgi:catechol 2,3-dioxygenase-like lactoylglutathione lyase family enzyme
MSTPEFRVHGFDHIQLAMPAGQEALAREFYSGVLGLSEVPKPSNLAKRGGVWFEGCSLRVHLGVEQDFRPAKKAHPAFLVGDLPALVRHLESAGIAVVTDEPLEGYARVYVADPLGNRLELLEPVAAR